MLVMQRKEGRREGGKRVVGRQGARIGGRGEGV